MIADLDADQRAAVTTESQLVAVDRRSRIGQDPRAHRRIAYRIAIGTADPRHMLVFTFTREAAARCVAGSCASGCASTWKPARSTR